jgi:hypothetical protein
MIDRSALVRDRLRVRVHDFHATAHRESCVTSGSQRRCSRLPNIDAIFFLRFGRVALLESEIVDRVRSLTSSSRSPAAFPAPPRVPVDFIGTRVRVRERSEYRGDCPVRGTGGGTPPKLESVRRSLRPVEIVVDIVR